jgi:hypothetical protein
MKTSGTDRETSDNVIFGSAPSEVIASAPEAARPVPLTFDPKEFLQYVKDHDLSEAEAYEFLATIWVYVVSWVDLGFGIHPAQRAGKNNSPETNPALDHESALVLTCRETFNNRTNKKTVPRQKRRAGRKDS